MQMFATAVEGYAVMPIFPVHSHFSVMTSTAVFFYFHSGVVSPSLCVLLIFCNDFAGSPVFNHPHCYINNDVIQGAVLAPLTSAPRGWSSLLPPNYCWFTVDGA